MMGKERIREKVRLLVILISALLLPGSTSSELNRADAGKKEVYGIVFMKSMFLNVNLNDALAAINIYINELQKNQPITYEFRSVIYEDTDDLIRSFDKDKLALVNLSSVDFLKYRKTLPMTPVMAAMTDKNSPLGKYLLIVKNNGPVNSARDLSQKKIALLPRTYTPIPHMWLDVMLYKNGIAKKKDYPLLVSDGQTESKVVMSLFFGQYDACVVSERAYQLMCELNPQVGRQLKILQTSPGYLMAVSCYTNTFMKKQDWKFLYERIFDIVSYPAGKQLFTLLKADRIVPFKEEYLITIKQLVEEYDLLARKIK